MSPPPDTSRGTPERRAARMLEAEPRRSRWRRGPSGLEARMLEAPAWAAVGTLCRPAWGWRDNVEIGGEVFHPYEYPVDGKGDPCAAMLVKEIDRVYWLAVIGDAVKPIAPSQWDKLP